MFNRSLATGLRPTITTVSVQPGVVSIQSRAKGTIKDPFEGEERKGGYISSFTLYHYLSPATSFSFFFPHSLALLIFIQMKSVLWSS